MVIFVITSIVFIALWIIERSKAKKAGNTILNAKVNMENCKKEADAYVSNKKAEADSFFESKKREALDYYWKKTENANKKAQELEHTISNLGEEKAKLQNEVDELGRDAICASVSIDAYSDLKSDEIKNKLALLQTRQDELIKTDSALVVTNESTQRRIVDSQKKQILRCFNSESSNIIGAVSVKNVDAARAKLQRSFDTLNKIFAIDGVQLSQEVFASLVLCMPIWYMKKRKESSGRLSASRW